MNDIKMIIEGFGVGFGMWTILFLLVMPKEFYKSVMGIDDDQITNRLARVFLFGTIIGLLTFFI